MVERVATPEHDDIRFKEIAMLKLLSRLVRLSRLSLLTGWSHLLGSLSGLPWRKPRPRLPSRRQPSWLDGNPAGEERALGCGWFDSSYELGHGLAVSVADAEAMSALPLSTWLDLELWNSCTTPQPS